MKKIITTLGLIGLFTAGVVFANPGAVPTVGQLISNPTTAGVILSSGIATSTLTASSTFTSGGGGTPAGSQGNVQYNNASAFGANANFTYATTTGNLGVGVASPQYKLDVGGDISNNNGVYRTSYSNLTFYDNTSSSSWRAFPFAVWTDGVAGRFNQWGGLNENLVNSAQFGTQFNRLGFDALQTQFTTGSYLSLPPVGVFEVMNGSVRFFNILSSGNTGIGSSTPDAKLTIQNTAQTNAFDVYNSNGNQKFLVTDTGSTTIPTLYSGTQAFDTDSGVNTLIDLPVSAAANGTVEGYSLSLNGAPQYTVAGISNGTGITTASTSHMFGTTTPSTTDFFQIQSNGKTNTLVAKNASGASIMTLSTAGNLTIPLGNVYGGWALFQRFYDQDDTTYFLDPNGATSAILAGSASVGTSTPANVRLHVVAGSASTTLVAIGSPYNTSNVGKLCFWNGTNYTVQSLASNSITPVYATSASCL